MTVPTALTMRTRVQGFVHAWGLLAEDRTACGQPLSPREAHALLFLRESEKQAERPRHIELQKHLGVDKSNVTRLVQRLDEAGWATQLAGEDDGRSRFLVLTAKGKRLADRLDEASLNQFARLLNAIPAARRNQVLDSLTLLEEAARAIAQ